MHPLPKLAWLVSATAVVLLTFSLGPLLVVAAAALVIASSAGLLTRLLGAMIPFLPLLASILLIQLLAPVGRDPGSVPVATLGPLALYGEGLGTSLTFAVRLLALQLATFLVVLTTRPAEVFEALDRLRVPRAVAVASSVTLLLVPILRREVDIVLTAQRARGLRDRGPIALARAVVPVLVASVERVSVLTVSLETRGFGSRAHRTSIRRRPLGGPDRLLLAGALGAGVVGVAVAVAGWGAERPSIIASPEVAVAVAVAALAVLVVLALRVLVVLGRR